MLTYPHIDPIAIAVGPLRVHWYGIMYLIGFLAAWTLARSVTSPRVFWIFIASRKLVSLPGRTNARTGSPAATSFSTMWLPSSPVAPVTKFIEDPFAQVDLSANRTSSG